MRIKNKKKAIKLCNEFLTELENSYCRSDEAYLYIWSWVDCSVWDILYGLTDRNQYYNPRIDWASKINETDGYIHCSRINENIKQNALQILTPFFDRWEQIKNCFE